ncbi:hypothetical protein [Pseudomonas sp. TE50-2]
MEHQIRRAKRNITDGERGITFSDLGAFQGNCDKANLAAMDELTAGLEY